MIALRPSSDTWVATAVGDLGTLLIDHAHCEKRAASTAVRFLFKYPDWARLCTAMSKLAREELLHFDQVRRQLEARGVPFRALSSAKYAAALFAQVTPSGGRGDGRFRAGGPSTIVDEMLCCALIEARSHERFVRLAANVPGVEEQRLAAFYAELAEAEARHAELYVEFAEQVAGGDVGARLDELAAVEAEIVARPGQPLRMHAGG
jgi:tRNA-(ms[2]io[6]A)-hydroxylase